MKKMVVILFVFANTLLFSQEANRFSVEFGAGYNSFAMNDLNEYYIETFAIPLKTLDEKIERGTNYNLQIKYQPRALFDFGLYGNYQFGKAIEHPVYTETDNAGNEIKHTGNFILKTDALSCGLSSCLYLSSLLKLHEKRGKFLNRLHVAAELNAGIGFSRSLLLSGFPTLGYEAYMYMFTSKDFQGQFSLKIAYTYLQNPLVSALGFKLGYQYLKTRNLKDINGEEWLVLGLYPIDLDFSGVNASLFLTVGK